MRECNHCGGPIPANRGNAAKYCSARCARLAERTDQALAKIKDRQKAKGRRNPKILAAYGYKCARCGWGIPTWAPGYKTVQRSGGCETHHIKPVVEGGTDEATNLVLLCPNCHKMAHVGLIPDTELQALTLTDTEINERWDQSRLKAGGEYILEKLFEA